MSTAVLLAEPEVETQAFLARHLKSDGFEVVDGEAAPDLVLLGDCAALDEFRSRLGDVPVIVLGDPESDTIDRVRAFERGCDDFVGRPFDYEELLGSISGCLCDFGLPSFQVDGTFAGALSTSADQRFT
jgi:DNA-binding response OmpR family regulator